jgi:hypothetical protein
MTYMLCRNHVTDFDKWHKIFSSHAAAHKRAGLHLIHLWRATEDANNIYFVFRLESIEKARAFIDAPEAADASKDSGVIAGEYHFVEDATDYTERKSDLYVNERAHSRSGDRNDLDFNSG